MNNYVYKFVLYIHVNGELENIIGIYDSYELALKAQYSEDIPYFTGFDIAKVKYYRC